MSSDPFPQPDSTPDPVPGVPVDSVTPIPLPPTPRGAASVDPLSPASVQASDSGLPANIAAGLAVLLPPLTSIIFLFLEKRSRFVRFWAMQGVLLGVAYVVFSIVSSVIWFTLASILGLLGGLWHLASWLIQLGFVIVWIVALIQAFSGKEWEIPLLGAIARQQLDKPPSM